MTLVYLVMLLALLQYYLFGVAVGRARATYGIPAPAISGNADFERVYRVHMNTLEQMVVMIPSMLVYAHYINARWAAAFGLIYIIGRIVYYFGYRRAANKRGLGFMISALPVMILLAGGIFALCRSLLTSGSL